MKNVLHGIVMDEPYGKMNVLWGEGDRRGGEGSRVVVCKAGSVGKTVN